MAITEQTAAIFEHHGRACVVTGESSENRPRIGGRPMGRYQAVHVQFIDGQEPPQALVGKKTWGKQAKPLRGAQLLVWRRVQHLVHQGLAPAAAKQQAMAELAKGVLANGGCC